MDSFFFFWLHYVVCGILLPWPGIEPGTTGPPGNSVYFYFKEISSTLLSKSFIPSQFSSVQSLSHVQLSRPHVLQHARPPCPSPTPGVYSNSCPSSRWCHPASHPLSPPSRPAFSLFQHQGLFQWVCSSHQVAQSIGVSASASLFPMDIQDWFPLGLTGWISLQSKGIWRIFPNTTVQKHQFFRTQLS